MSIFRWVNICLLLLLLSSCSSTTDEQLQTCELYNLRAFNYRYTSLDSLETNAAKALSFSKGSSRNIAESYNNLGLAAYMRQDFMEANRCYEEAKKATHNQIELLISDIGLLKVCARASENKKFYDYETRIQKRLKRLKEESSDLDEHDLFRLMLAESDYHITASIYYYYMQQDQKARNELSQIKEEDLAVADTAQWTYYEYMLASVNMLGGTTYEEDVKMEFDTLLRLLFMSREKNLIYMEGNVLEAFTEKFLDPKWNEIATQNRSADFLFLNPEGVPDSLFIETLALKALECFKNYGDYYQLAGARRQLADVYFYKGEYEQALGALLSALNDMNIHHQKYNKLSGESRLLQPYSEEDSMAVDLIWMENDSISTVPQWLANIRQSLSMAYSALGNKQASDYNRNIYLDLLDKTRQDKEQENRFDQLDRETRNLNILFWVIVALTLIGGCLLVLLNRKWRRKNANRIEKLSITAELCSYISSSIPTNVDDKDELLERMASDLKPKLLELFEMPIAIQYDEAKDKLLLVPESELNKDDRSLLSLIEPYLNWAYQYGSTYLNMDDEFRQLEKERYLHEQHIVENKLQNLDKRTCMSIVTGITPFLDRALNEINRLNDKFQTEEQKNERYIYIQELIDRINEYNDIMSLWIKMKQGTVSLRIETFQLADIFSLVGKSKHAYEVKNQKFVVDDTNLSVKADKALTLFMVNTLCDNARKYTPEGGLIHIFATEAENYVEISVKDTGRGLSDEDRRRIIEEKIYDSGKIGISGDDSSDKELADKKGFGFGLMNCKGIIDKYKKTNSIFNVCLFDIETELGKGSRFFFRLPKGILRLFVGFLCLFSSLNAYSSPESDAMLRQAAAYADSTYYSNIDGYYRRSLEYADSACYFMNQYYLYQYPQSSLLMSIQANGSLAELEWWDKGVNTDYHIILDIRNEVAVAALALCEWDIYKTNNTGYTRLYKLLGEDNTLDRFCEQMQKTAGNKRVSNFILILVILAFVVVFYALYFRQSLMYRLNVQQVLEINRDVLQTFDVNVGSENIIKLPEKMLHKIYPDLNSIHLVEDIAIQIKDANGNLLPICCTNDKAKTENLEVLLRDVMESKSPQKDLSSHMEIYPLLVHQEGKTNCIGSFAFINKQTTSNKNESVLIDLVLNYVSIIIYQTVIRLSYKQSELDAAEDDKRRAIHEENLIHVQNMMLDNCLSTLKHETMYYPNRIRQIVDRLQDEKDPQKVEEQTQVMRELIYYYKDIFTTLSDLANRQLENTKFSRARIPLEVLKKHLEKYFAKVVKKNSLDWNLSVDVQEDNVIGDQHLLCYFMETLVNAALEKVGYGSSGDFTFKSGYYDGFSRLEFTDSRGKYTQQELNLLFYPSLERMSPDASGILHGTQYLNMKQIIRDHDELCGHRGCRINAEPLDSGGYKIWFTLPLAK